MAVGSSDAIQPGAHSFYFGRFLFFCSEGSPTPQPPLRQVGIPNFGKIHCRKTSHAITMRARPIH